LKRREKIILSPAFTSTIRSKSLEGGKKNTYLFIEKSINRKVLYSLKVIHFLFPFDYLLPRKQIILSLNEKIIYETKANIFPISSILLYFIIRRICAIEGARIKCKKKNYLTDNIILKHSVHIYINTDQTGVVISSIPYNLDIENNSVTKLSVG